MTSSTFFKAAFLFCAFCLSHILSAQDIKPIKGKWNAGDARDYVGFWKLSQKKGYLDGSGNGTISGITAVLGFGGDMPLTLNYQGDARDEFALYSPSTRKLVFFQDYSRSTSESYSRVVGNSGDLVITGDWNGDGVDGFAIYDPPTRQLSYFQNIDSPQAFASVVVGSAGDIPLAGNWDGLNGDGFALYTPSTRQIWFFQSFNDTHPFTSRTVGNTGDMITAGDWDGNGTDGIAVFQQPTATGYQFWLFNDISGPATQSIAYADGGYASDISAGRRFFYATQVPHVDVDGNYRTTYSPTLSFFPKALYSVPSSEFGTAYDAGYNLAFVWRTNFVLTPSDKAALDATGNKLKAILYLSASGGIPLVGKFTGTHDLPGIGSDDGSKVIYYDSNGDDVPDTQFATGNSTDVPFIGDWNGDGIDEFALFQKTSGPVIQFFSNMSGIATLGTPFKNGKSTDNIVSGNWDGLSGDGYALYDPTSRFITFYQNYNDTQYLSTGTAGQSGDIIFSGDWDGDGKDGYALYRPSTREFFFYQTYNSNTYFLTKTFGNSGDIPVSGDWDGDGKDGFGIYRTDELRSRHEFWYYNDVNNTTAANLRSTTFGHPQFENVPTKYAFGIYAFDEPTKEESWQQNYDYLTSVYSTFSAKPGLIFHVDIPYVGSYDPNYNYWWRRFAVLGEVTAHDDYPVSSRGPGSPTSTETVLSVGSIAETVDYARFETNEGKPNWFVPQAFENPTSDPYKFYKPTPEQYKAMVYTGLIHGATGILAFMHDDPRFGSLRGISPTINADLWNETKTVNQEIDVLKPYLLNVTSPALYSIYADVVPSYESLPIRSLLKLVNGYYVLITVNMTKQPVKAIIQLPTGVAPSDRVVERLFEGTTTKTLAGAINDAYGAFGVHVYKFKAPSGGFGGGRLRPQEEAPAVAKTEKGTDVVKVYPVPSKGLINFDIGDVPDSEATLVLYDGKGQVVKTFHENNPAHKRLLWEGTTDHGDASQPGIYFYKLNGNGRVIGSGKFILIH